jgi:hypothetical protein
VYLGSAVSHCSSKGVVSSLMYTLLTLWWIPSSTTWGIET